MKMFIIVVYFLGLFNVYYSNELKLTYKKYNSSKNNSYEIIQPDLINNNTINNESKRKLDTNKNFLPIRIYIDTSLLEKQYSQITDADANYNIKIILDSIKRAKEAIEELINVERRKDKLTLNNEDLSKLNEVGFSTPEINNTFIQNGIDNCDLLIFVRFSDENKDIESIHETRPYFAKPRIIKQENNYRPLIGSVIYYKRYNNGMRTINERFQKEIISTIFLHEYIHILGFMNQIFDQFNGKSQIFETISINRTGKIFNKKIVKSNKILNIAKKYFNCSAIKGIELDSQGNTEELGTSHWEGRILFGDIMISDLYFQEQIVSEFTLALLEESGWYKANYYTGGLMNFGKNKGCDFLNSDCIKLEEIEIRGQTIFYYDIPFPKEFCYESKSDGTCSVGRISRGYCLNSKEITDEKYKRKRKTNLGMWNVEYCPVSIDSYMGISYYYGGNCKLGNNGTYGEGLSFPNNGKYSYSIFSKNFGEKYSDNSFCALSSVLHKNESIEKLDIYGKYIRPTCYPMFCSKKSLTIQINEIFVVCPRNGSVIEIGGEYTGYILCPDYNTICSGTVVCNNLFDCIKNKSEIKDENYTYDYSIDDVITNVGIDTNEESYYQDKLIIGYELGDDGKCPRDCIQCLENRRCLICRNFTENILPFYIGINEIDNLEILCLKDHPTEGYYNKSNYYYKCVDNCVLCENQYECLKCGLTHYIGDNKKCEERIVGCRDYNPDPEKIVDEPRNGENGKGYSECLNCKNDENYYCLDGNFSTCVYLNDYNIETYYEMEDRNFSCVQKCEKRFTNCEKCNKTSCYECIKNATYIINNQGNCIEKIDYCKNQNKDVEYKQCLECDNQYYCIQNNTLNCRKVENISLYYSYKYIIDDKEINCFERCNNTLRNCLKCNKNSCTLCLDGYELNNNNYCVKKIDNCVNQNMDINYEQCLQCRSNYYCIGNDSAHCQSIDNIQYYYNFTETPIYCIQRCNETFDYCVNCDKNECKKCEEGSFIYNGACIKNITGCINHFYDGSEKECLECNEDAHWYCIDKNKMICHNTTLEKLLPYYYTFPDIDYSCYGKCNNFIENCVKCNNNTYCIECKENYIVSDNGNECIFFPFDIPTNDSCSVNINKSYLNIYKIEPLKFTDYYWKNIPYVKIVEHYIGNNYTITVFVHSECTEDLLNQGYFKIDSKELQNIMIKESKTKGLKIIFAVYINYNHKSHLRFYNFTSNYLLPEKLCPSCFKSHYTITSKINEAINNTLGPLILNLLMSEKIDIIKRDSDVYTDICQNVTLLGIDIPLKKRLKYLYLHEYSDIIYCISENCTIDEYFKDNLTVGCKCLFGNKLEDIFRDDKKFEYKFNQYEGELKESNEFVESLGIIKCSIKGFNLHYFTNNIGAILCLIAIAAQIILFLYYCFCSKAIINVNKSLVLSNPPKKIMSKLSSDLNNLSIDTNIEGAIKNISTENKGGEEIDQGKNKSKNYQDYLKTDSNIIPLPQEEIKLQNLKFGKIYWHVLSLKHHIINFFSSINCFNITESFIPLSIRFIRSIFMIILSFVFNILLLNQTYYEKKLEHFQAKYKLVYSENGNIKIPLGEKISYATGKVFGKAIISLILLLLVQLIIGAGFLPIRNKVIKAKRKKSQKEIQELVSKTKIKYTIFFITTMILMVLFFFSLAGFGGAYGGGFIDYLTSAIISLIFFEIFPFLWSIVIALFRYFGFKNKNMNLLKISQFFMF